MERSSQAYRPPVRQGNKRGSFMAASDNRLECALDDLQAQLRSAGTQARIAAFNVNLAEATVISESYLDWLLAKAALKRKGVTAVQR